MSADTVMPLWKGELGSESRLMLTTAGPAPTEVWRWHLEPGEEYPGHPRQGRVVETLSVTAGQMVLMATFDGDAPHTYRGAGDGTCHLIRTLHLPPAPAA
ncbi:hypothetical protein QFZ58_006612 [Streptomyces sp. B1I3]|nr:hypothetical protein [Streptomyces sp. B1I3]